MIYWSLVSVVFALVVGSLGLGGLMGDSLALSRVILLILSGLFLLGSTTQLIRTIRSL